MAKPKIEETDDDAMVVTLGVPAPSAILSDEQRAEMKAKADELSAKYTGFKISSKADYEGLKLDLRKTVRMRTQTEEWRKSVKRLADEVSADILGMFAPAEALMSGLKKSYDDAEAIRLKAIKDALDKLLADRKAEMFALGATYNGSAYVLGELEIFPEDVPVDKYLLKIESMRAERARLDELEKARVAEVERQQREKAEADRLAKIESDRIADENAKLRAELDALKAAKVVTNETVAYTVSTAESAGPNTTVEMKVLYGDDPEPIAPSTDVTTNVAPDSPQPPVLPVTAPPAKFQPYDGPLGDPHDMLLFKSGAYAMVKAARARFPQISAQDWKSLWDEFREASEGQQNS